MVTRGATPQAVRVGAVLLLHVVEQIGQAARFPELP
jgi:hypothetical protein